jgi:hypothetical protein
MPQIRLCELLLETRIRFQPIHSNSQSTAYQWRKQISGFALNEVTGGVEALGYSVFMDAKLFQFASVLNA